MALVEEATAPVPEVKVPEDISVSGARTTQALAAAAPAAPSAPARRERQQHRAGREQRPLLVRHGQPEGQARPQPAPVGGQQDGRHAQRAAEQLLGMADFQRPEGDRVGDADAERDSPGESGVALAAHAVHQPDPKGGAASRQGSASIL